MDRNSQPFLKSVYALSLLSGLALLGFALKMLLFPTVTEEPSFINCFSYIDAAKRQILLWAAIGIAGAIVWLSIQRQGVTIIFIEAAMLWVLAYCVIVALSAAPYVGSLPQLVLGLTLLGSIVVIWLLGVRWALKRRQTTP